MRIKCFKDFLFKKETGTPSHVSFSILGVKIHFLKPAIRKERKHFAKYYQSFSDATKIPPAEGNLRIIQKANVSLLECFDKLCKENDLTYWIDFGTLLGSARHKGFIPWDDDIDLGMLREDYEKLIELFSEGLLQNTDLDFGFENNGQTKCFMKIYHKKSENLFIDIFPYDCFASKLSADEKKELSQKIVETRKIKNIKCDGSDSSMRNKFKELTKKYILEDKIAEKNEEPAIFMGIDFPHNWKNKVYDWNMIFPLKLVSFENKTFPAPAKVEDVLMSIYGDFMKVPKNSYPRHSDYSLISDEEKRFLEDFAS